MKYTQENILEIRLLPPEGEYRPMPFEGKIWEGGRER
jgi:hypothetical protein